LGVCNARQNHATPLVSQWCAFVVETYQQNPTRANEDMILQSTYDMYHIKMNKQFDLTRVAVLRLSGY